MTRRNVSYGFDRAPAAIAVLCEPRCHSLCLFLAGFSRNPLTRLFIFLTLPQLPSLLPHLSLQPQPCVNLDVIVYATSMLVLEKHSDSIVRVQSTALIWVMHSTLGTSISLNSVVVLYRGGAWKLCSPTSASASPRVPWVRMICFAPG